MTNDYEEVDYVIKTLKTSKLTTQKTLVILSHVMTWFNTPPKFEKEPVEGKQPEVSHPVIDSLTSYILEHGRKPEYLTTLDKIRDLRKKSDDLSKSFSILRSYELEGVAYPFHNDPKPYLNPEESDILSLEDLTDIDFSKAIDSKKLKEVQSEINTLLFVITN